MKCIKLTTSSYEDMKFTFQKTNSGIFCNITSTYLSQLTKKRINAHNINNNITQTTTEKNIESSDN